MSPRRPLGPRLLRSRADLGGDGVQGGAQSHSGTCELLGAPRGDTYELRALLGLGWPEGGPVCKGSPSFAPTWAHVLWNSDSNVSEHMCGLGGCFSVGGFSATP